MANHQPKPIGAVSSPHRIVGALDRHPGLRAVCVGAARQVALGCPLGPRRRAALVDWARRVDRLVVEDDYYSEFSYDRPAPPVLQGTARDRVALLGSMSQALGPTVAVGWVVLSAQPEPSPTTCTTKSGPRSPSAGW